MLEADDIRAVLQRIADAGLPHMVVGALAVDALVGPRSTADVDIQLSVERFPPVTVSSFLGCFIEERAHDPVFDQDVLIVHPYVRPTMFEFFRTTHWFTTQALERRQHVASRALGVPIPIPTPEDLVLLKAKFFVSPARSKRKRVQDGVDIENIFRYHGPSLDGRYLEENARRLGVWDEVQQIRDEVLRPV